ncbi:hypothetical protein MFMK1_002209 [Metallumcola ferriviriculae]|uniref:DNA-3-methyladenine glycosylase II n=1 Tax=Metallumcola ferriviriculae TaxID=3039180 RepID=A0AAU0UQ05_9FIRM|nr:hypothetical protein MFMK1_002209 [Desulfitibacteraceae bacterium MK1]
MGTQVFTDNGIELNHIKDSEHKMAYLIDRIGNCTLNLRTDLFQSLIRIIIGQQLSIKAATTIWRRIERDLDEVSPEQIIAAPDDKLRSMGLSRQKISYAKYLSDTVLSDKLNLESMHDLSDKEVLELLTKIKGIGRWSAEMFMIFSQQMTLVLKERLNGSTISRSSPVKKQCKKWARYGSRIEQ